ncbi:Hypothetical protein PHPALM_5262 [Phytophthora palmivora]|uniref:Uncharacterized protein n=1 Tax=Phytophthora palmivora TaxID=4796 RepID=A0A2P4YHR4_9STRA|nr:Hypothetical protein PHPALM_5262 [Phytophthora palmivora]
MSWNLMARAANNTVSIYYKHLEWREDALCVYFAHMKNDRRGAQPRDPRHVYANLMAAEMCPILPLGKSIITVLHQERYHAAQLQGTPVPPTPVYPRGYFPPDAGSGSPMFLEHLKAPRGLNHGRTSRGAYERALVQDEPLFVKDIEIVLL